MVHYIEFLLRILGSFVIFHVKTRKNVDWGETLKKASASLSFKLHENLIYFRARIQHPFSYVEYKSACYFPKTQPKF